jgi:cytidylate kinase
MKTELEDLELCRAYILSRLEEEPRSSAKKREPGPAITLSVQTGTDVREVAGRLRQILQEREDEGKRRWTVFNRQLIEKVLEEHDLPKQLSKSLPEERRSYIRDVTEELLGLRPPSWVIGPEIVETVLHLADVGRVILIGRGANFITSHMANVLHVRLIGSLEKRTARVQTQRNLSPEEAARYVELQDRARGRYLKAHFHVRAEDALHYDLVINTDRMRSADTAQLIADGAQRYFQHLADRGNPGQSFKQSTSVPGINLPEAVSAARMTATAL